MTDLERIDADPYTRPAHCDSRVLHAPGECVYCDRRPLWQRAREVWRINFTGHHDPRKLICPSEIARPLEDIELWHGNVARSPGDHPDVVRYLGPRDFVRTGGRN